MNDTFYREFWKGVQMSKDREVPAPQLGWIARQYPNKGTWWSACDRFSVHVTDQGTFYACIAGWAIKPYPWDGDNEFDTLAKAIRHCEVYAARVSSVQPKEEA